MNFQITLMMHIFLLTSFLSIYIVHSNVISEKPDSDVCETDGCRKAAKEVLDNIDETVNPCEDFYEFACGGYKAKRTIPEDKPTVGVFEDVEDEVSKQVRALLDIPLDGSEVRFVKLVKDIYDSCVNLDQIEVSGSKPLKEILTSLGGWPVTQGDQWDESKFDWMETVFALRRLGFRHDTLISIYVEEDFKNNTVHITTIDQPSFGLPDRSYLIAGLNDSATAAYYNLMVKAANKLGANSATSKNELLDAFKFEMALAEHSLPNEERRNYSAFYNKYAIKDLQLIAPQVDWYKYISGHFNELISPMDNVLVLVPNYVKNFAQLITNTDKRTVANYMLWRVVAQSAPLLSKDWRDMWQELVSAVIGSTETKARWEECLNSFSTSLAMSLGHYYVKTYFKDESRDKALDLLKYLRNEFISMVDKLEWMQSSTKTQTIDKANSIIAYVGYPPEIFNESLVLEHYENLTITPDNYFKNILNMKKWKMDDLFSKLRKPNLIDDWKKHAHLAISNAYYNPTQNSIDVPAGILQKSFFNKDRPYYMNFGAIGFVIGHEITHGFDDVGRQFDKDGNHKNWWDDTTDKLFREKAQCIIDQYSNYTIDGLKVNGKNTQGENIADNGGVKEAYWAYQSWVKDNGAEPKLPGLKYSPEQLFWISAANVWCAKDRPEYSKLIILSDEHSPTKFRVFGSMSNLHEFSDAFQCDIGSPMNPKKKCEVW